MEYLHICAVNSQPVLLTVVGKFSEERYAVWAPGSVIFILTYFLVSVLVFSIFSFSFVGYQNIKPADEDVLMICLNTVHS